MGTAFGLLLLLVAVIVAIRIVSEYVLERGATEQAAQTLTAEADAREKALAAVVGVTAVLAQRDRGNGPQPNGA